MTDKELIEKLGSLMGRTITEIKYTPTKFHYSTIHGNWTDSNPDLFVLHSP
ncbi:hypothetical protein D3C71_2097340 [compost metagenome]